MSSLQVGLQAQMQQDVNDSNAISFLGDGGPRVLATPALIMFLEMTSRNLAKAHLDEGYDTVGTHVDVKHLAATPIGMSVTFHSELIEATDRRLRFRVEAFDAKEKIAEGFHERAIINVAKFAARVAAKSGA
jgi:fluoroacetyl-CoA thioesterase